MTSDISFTTDLAKWWNVNNSEETVKLYLETYPYVKQVQHHTINTSSYTKLVNELVKQKINNNIVQTFLLDGTKYFEQDYDYSIFLNKKYTISVRNKSLSKIHFLFSITHIIDKIPVINWQFNTEWKFHLFILTEEGEDQASVEDFEEALSNTINYNKYLFRANETIE